MMRAGSMRSAENTRPLNKAGWRAQASAQIRSTAASIEAAGGGGGRTTSTRSAGASACVTQPAVMPPPIRPVP